MESKVKFAEDPRPPKLQRTEDAAADAATAAAASEAEPQAAAAATATKTEDSSSSNVEDKEASSSPTNASTLSPSSTNSSSSNSNSNSSSSSSSKKELEAAWEETEYNNWRVNSQVLYDVLLNVPLDWPSLTVQWLPGITPCSTSSVVKQRLLLGTHTSGEEPDALIVMQVELPVGPFDDQQTNEYKERGDYEGFHYGLSSYKLKVVKRLPHPRESNCARYMPQRPAIVASCAVDGRVLLYNLEAEGVCEGPEAALVGNKGEATCLSWNPNREGQIVACGSEGSWAVYDAAATALKEKSPDGTPGSRVGERSARFNSCCWAAADVFLIAQEDSIVSLWDIRQDTSKPSGEMLNLYDWRRLDIPLHAVEASTDHGVSFSSFSSFLPSVCLSGGNNKFISLWDFNRVGEEQDPEDAEDGPPELLFTHGGHRADIYDASWNCEERFPQMVASVANDNRLHIWQPKSSVFFESDSEEEEDADQLEVLWILYSLPFVPKSLI
ncbi:WD domain, G-beta repeat domain containing protein, putative [Eimeria maxima]|uniref:WD domain, G-beta repeat domain containing protein, putative n=1 Tax=Eimeria maxima TaxID=5804 RepID=U6M701_EIMMA|nr:WD domain, G-beta repeat domain containing protein, putative [Eimeria maxima]CDJ59997.1 WD domain, G-beta repeat domain containing protein, putative [Eimeria maxima]